MLSKTRVLMVDPSLFTYPHDSRLARALTGTSVIKLIGRPLRLDERDKISDPFPVVELFYGLSERLRRRFGERRFVFFVKALEHIWGMFRLLRFAKRWRPDVIHFQWMVIPCVDKFFIARLRKICPVNLTVHDMTPFNGNPSSQLQSLGFAGGLAGFDGLIVHTDGTLDLLRRRGFHNDKLCYVGIPPDISVIDARCQGAIRQLSSATGAPVRIVMAGLLKPYKGVDLAIKAANLLPLHIMDRAQLIIAGKPKMPMQPLFDLQKKMLKPEIVEWRLQYMSAIEMCSVMAAADIFLFPYRGIEGSGMFSQALVFEKPVIATNFGVFAETVSKYKCGLLTAPTSDDLSRNLTKLIESKDLYDECCAGAKAAHADLPTWADVAERISTFYGRI